uniref:Legume lectin domain-containing protein n=1 Tax=Nelumbo nucifera TaxID=4432 RepID=A0A822ZKM8_NELNU|nr:TPA_asm: hypothetical protein HUJ06_002149 [Nelumbo nucifera]
MENPYVYIVPEIVLQPSSFQVSVLNHGLLQITELPFGFSESPLCWVSYRGVLIIYPFCSTISFKFSSLCPNTQKIEYEGDASATSRGTDLTKDQINTNLQYSSGRATYKDPVHLWDKATGRLTDFTTNFSFFIRPTNKEAADGFAFFLAPNDYHLPRNSSGGFLGLLPYNNKAHNSSDVQIVAVEFDTFKNSWDVPES